MSNSKEEFVREYVRKYLHLIPDYLKDNDDFLVFFALLCHEFGITYKNIEKFTDIVNPDTAPAKFLEYLGAYVNYRYLNNASESFNREVLTRYRTIFEDRGTEHSIIMAATHGYNDGYVGGDIFIPGYEISDDIAQIIVGRERVFTHSRSKHSSLDVFSNADWYRPGVLIIELPFLNKRVRDKIYEVTPAGIRYKYVIRSEFGSGGSDDIGSNGVLSWGDKNRIVPIPEHGDLITSENNPISVDLYAEILVPYTSVDILVHSDGRFGRKLHSGGFQIGEDNIIESSVGVSALPVSALKVPFALSNMDQEFIKDFEERKDAITQSIDMSLWEYGTYFLRKIKSDMIMYIPPKSSYLLYWEYDRGTSLNGKVSLLEYDGSPSNIIIDIDKKFLSNINPEDSRDSNIVVDLEGWTRIDYADSLIIGVRDGYVEESEDGNLILNLDKYPYGIAVGVLSENIIKPHENGEDLVIELQGWTDFSSDECVVTILDAASMEEIAYILNIRSGVWQELENTASNFISRVKEFDFSGKKSEEVIDSGTGNNNDSDDNFGRYSYDPFIYNEFGGSGILLWDSIYIGETLTICVDENRTMSYSEDSECCILVYKESEPTEEEPSEDGTEVSTEDTLDTVERREAELWKVESELYILSETGEYLDRKDKLYADSVTRDIDTLIDVDDEVKYKIKHTFSTSKGIHSGRSLHSGLFMDEYDSYISLMDIQPSDILYPVSEVLDCTSYGDERTREFPHSFYDGSGKELTPFPFWGDNRNPFNTPDFEFETV